MENNDLISRSALIAKYDRVHVGEPGMERKLMEDAPAVDAVPVRHGRWVKMDTTGLLAVGTVWNCSSCGYPVGVSVVGSKYCPNCGAKMDGDEDEKSD